MRPVSASLDPTDFRHEVADRREKITISQVEHGIQMRSVSELHIPCACGRPLCGLETELLTDGVGYGLYYMGVCLSCGRQSGIYSCEPKLTPEMALKRREARIAADVNAIVQSVRQLHKDTETEDAVQSAEEEVATMTTLLKVVR